MADEPTKRGIGRPFPRGVSPNPGGRPKAVVELQRRLLEKTNDGVELEDFALRVMRGQEEDMQDARSRLAMHAWISDRMFGRAPQSVDVTMNDAVITPEQAAMLEALKLSPHSRRSRIAELKARAVEAVVTTTEEPEPISELASGVPSAERG
jgi:hypothetical protein